MTRDPPMQPPGSRVLLGWWRELAPLGPRRFWFASLLLSRLEALVDWTVVHSLDPLQLAVLRSLAGVADEATVQIDERWRTPLICELSDLGLLQDAELTKAGRAALAEGAVVSHSHERKVFYFLEGPPARFLPVLRPAGVPLPTPPGWKLDPAVLETCIRQPEAWKLRRQFPRELERLVVPAMGSVPDWSEVIVVGPEALTLVLVQVAPGDSGRGLLGFAARSDGWILDMAAPVLALPEGWTDVLPGLADEPALDEWRRAWQVWCQQRSIPATEIDACEIENIDHRLVVRAPARLLERLRATRSDALKGEAWLLAGAGRSRAAAQVELVEG
jgi:hypothetical protein